MKQKEILQSLDIISNISHEMKIQFFFLGSFLGAAINGAFYRAVEDIDFIVMKSTGAKLKIILKRKNFLEI